MSAPGVVAKMLPCDDDGLLLAGELLRDGQCVAFPTETVYGLGANALNPMAVSNIFKFKGRPLTDPLIVHVITVEDALALVRLGVEGEALFRRLAGTFWPVTASTGFVGVRSPSHPIARSLIEKAGIPVAAPSANRFCHVSPTTAAHVMSDLSEQPIYIIDGESAPAASIPACGVGIESTVIKIDEALSKVVLFRQGGVPEAAIRSVVESSGFGSFEVYQRHRAVVKIEEEAQEAPGQHVTHYAPDHLSTFLVNGISSKPLLSGDRLDVSKVIVLDFGGRLSSLAKLALSYRDLSPSGDASEGCKNVFSMLRACEEVKEAQFLLLCDPLFGGSPTKGLEDSLRDRLFRCASGQVGSIALEGDSAIRIAS